MDVTKFAAGTPSWFDLMTPDVPGARRFYGGLFGWTFVLGPPEAGGYSLCKSRGLKAAGIGPLPKHAPYPSAWTMYLATDDADATAALIRASGGNVMMGPMDVMTEGRMAIAIDPSGGAFGLWQPRDHRGAEVKDEHGAMAWTELVTRDLSSAKDFYAKIMGATLEKIDAGGMDYFMVKKGDATVAGMMAFQPGMPEGIPSHWVNYVTVDDADAAVATVERLGGKIVKPAMDSPYGRFAFVSDPYGANFAVIQLPARP
jgi:predicted enzyme related to lactoylglutathione lyase